MCTDDRELLTFWYHVEQVRVDPNEEFNNSEWQPRHHKCHEDRHQGDQKLSLLFLASLTHCYLA